MKFRNSLAPESAEMTAVAERLNAVTSRGKAEAVAILNFEGSPDGHSPQPFFAIPGAATEGGDE